MVRNLSERDKKALKLGTAGVVVILVFAGATLWFENWRQVRKDLQSARAHLSSISSGGAKEASLVSVVPKFEMPKKEKAQMILFRDEFNRQLKKSGIKAKSLGFVGGKKTRKVGGYKVLRLQCRGRCRYSQVLDLLADLSNNAYFVGVEDVQLKANTKDRKQVDLVLTVSTFAK